MSDLEAMAARWEEAEAAREGADYEEAVEAGFMGTLEDYRAAKAHLMNPTTEVWDLTVVPGNDNIPF
jgi:hypothetical protein